MLATMFSTKARKAWMAAGAAGASAGGLLLYQSSDTIIIILGTLGAALVAFATTYATPNA
jgi:hypothetical protein